MLRYQAKFDVGAYDHSSFIIREEKDVMQWAVVFITNFIMQPCQSYSYKTEVVVPSKVSQFISFAEKGTNVMHSEDQFGGYWTLTSVEGDRGIQRCRATG